MILEERKIACGSVKYDEQASSKANGAKSQISGTATSQCLLVGNIHALFNPNRGDIKLGQLDILMPDRRNIFGQIRNPLKWEPFNPKGKFMKRSKSLRYSWNKEEIDLAAGCREFTYLKHNLRLQSAYPGVPKPKVVTTFRGPPYVKGVFASRSIKKSRLWMEIRLLENPSLFEAKKIIENLFCLATMLMMARESDHEFF